MWHTGLVAPQHVGSSRTRARNHVPFIGRRILNYCPPGKPKFLPLLRLTSKLSFGMYEKVGHLLCHLWLGACLFQARFSSYQLQTPLPIRVLGIPETFVPLRALMRSEHCDLGCLCNSVLCYFLLIYPTHFF